MSQLGKYSKTVAAVVTYVLAWAAQVIASKPAAITSAEWLALAGGLAVALGVYGVANATSAPAPATMNYTFTPPPGGWQSGTTITNSSTAPTIGGGAVVDPSPPPAP